MTARLIQGDALEVLKTLPTESVDALVCDPPAGIGFMGKGWDGDKGGRRQWIDWLTGIMREALRVLKPGAHGLVWALPRTSHWTATALEDAGFTIREKIFHHFGSGFPKNLNVSAQIDRCLCSKSVLSDHYERMPILQEAFAENATEPGPPVLQSEVRWNGKAHAPGHLDLSGVRQGLGAEDQIPSQSQFSLLERMRLPTDVSITQGQGSQAAAVRGLSALRPDVSDHEQPQDSEALFVEMLGRSPSNGSGIPPKHEESRRSRASRLDGCESDKLQAENDRPEESGLEGRRDLQQQARELWVNEIHPLPGPVPANGTQGRLRDGTPADRGAMGWTDAATDGGCPPQRPQSDEQQPLQSGVVALESEPQGSGAWPLCSGCGKPMVPDGLGTALKPAVEEWILVRKPFRGTVAGCVLEHGTGALNIGECRVEASEALVRPAVQRFDNTAYGTGLGAGTQEEPPGRWPAHLLLTHSAACNGTCAPDCPVRALDEQSGASVSTGGGGFREAGADTRNGIFGKYGARDLPSNVGLGDSGGASRFFQVFTPEPPFIYCPKPSTAEREQGTEWMARKQRDEAREADAAGANNPRNRGGLGRGNHHPTVKAVALMQWLCKLVTPPGGTVLDCFMGSGSTGIACLREGFEFIGIELDPAFVEIARERIRGEAPLFAEATP